MTENTPANVEAEESVLGALLIDRDAIVLTSPILGAGDFYKEANGAIYQAVVEMYRAHRPADFVTLCDFLDKKGMLEAVGGREYLTGLLAVTPTAVHVEYYAHLVKRDAEKRRLIRAAGGLAKVAYGEATDTQGVYAEAEKVWSDFKAGLQAVADCEPNSAYVQRYMMWQDDLGRMVASGKSLPTFPWGAVRKKVPALVGGMMCVVTAPTSHGKTAFVEQLAEYNAERGHRVGFFHLELTPNQMTYRQLCRQIAWVDRDEEMQGNVNRDTLARLGQLTSDWPGHVDYVHCPGWTVDQICGLALRKAMQGLWDLVIIDYLDKISLTGQKGFSAELMIAANAEAVKTTAEKADIPIILLTQVHRTKEEGPRKLTVDDIRGSGQVPDKANVAFGIYNHAHADENGIDRTVDLYVMKNTFGSCGKVQLLFDGPRYRFLDVPKMGA